MGILVRGWNLREARRDLSGKGGGALGGILVAVEYSMQVLYNRDPSREKLRLVIRHFRVKSSICNAKAPMQTIEAIFWLNSVTFSVYIHKLTIRNISIFMYFRLGNRHRLNNRSQICTLPH